MRLQEQRLWDDTRESLGGGWMAERVENKLKAGTPDVCFTGRKRRWAWMELKVLEKLPSEARKFDIGHFTPEQRAFGLQAIHHGGMGSWYLLTRCADVDHLHRANVIDLLGEVNYSVFRKKAIWVGRIRAPGSASAILDLLFS